jgi:hypothetical protein
LVDEDWAVTGRTLSREQAVSPRMTEVKRPRRIDVSLVLNVRCGNNGRRKRPADERNHAIGLG